MARSLLPFVQNGYYASRNWIPLVKGNGFTTSGGGEQEEVWETASGPIVTFDAVAAPLRQLSVAVEPVQNLNGYDNPWPAGGGANKLPPFDAATKTLGTTTCTFDGNGNCTLKAVADSTARTFTFDVTPFTTPTGTCYIHLLNSAGNNGVTMSFRDASDGAIGGSFSFSGTSPNKIIALTEEQKGQVVSKIRVYKNAAQTDFEITFSPMLLETNAATTTYIPYSNICPITGWDSVTVNRTGKNLLMPQTGSPKTINGVTFTFNDDGSVTITATEAPTANQTYCGIYGANSTNISILQPLISGLTSGGNMGLTIEGGAPGVYIVAQFNKGDGTLDGTQYTTSQLSGTVPSDAEYMYVAIRVTKSEVTTPLNCTVKLQITNSTATAYEPYNGNEYTIQLGETVYGGTLDVVNGKMTVDRANIASYNGEILPGFWISDRDVYSAGATPTTGAQVVYELATPYELTLTPQQIATLQGTNNVWSDAGDVTVEYRAQ